MKGYNVFSPSTHKNGQLALATGGGGGGEQLSTPPPPELACWLLLPASEPAGSQGTFSGQPLPPPAAVFESKTAVISDDDVKRTQHTARSTQLSSSKQLQHGAPARRTGT